MGDFERWIIYEILVDLFLGFLAIFIGFFGETFFWIWKRGILGGNETCGILFVEKRQNVICEWESWNICIFIRGKFFGFDWFGISWKDCICTRRVYLIFIFVDWLSIIKWSSCSCFHFEVCRSPVVICQIRYIRIIIVEIK